jgi:hypothetical protein
MLQTREELINTHKNMGDDLIDHMLFQFASKKEMLLTVAAMLDSCLPSNSGRVASLRCDFGRSLPSWGVNYNSVMERVVVSFLALVAAATAAISLGIIANDALGIPPTEIRLSALSGVGFMFVVLVCANTYRPPGSN